MVVTPLNNKPCGDSIPTAMSWQGSQKKLEGSSSDPGEQTHPSVTPFSVGAETPALSVLTPFILCYYYQPPYYHTPHFTDRNCIHNPAECQCKEKKEFNAQCSQKCCCCLFKVHHFPLSYHKNAKQMVLLHKVL